MSELRERPILFSGPMVRAIIEGRKTQTRRVMKSQPTLDGSALIHADFGLKESPYSNLMVDANLDGHFEATCRCCPYGKRGDRLWVREACRVASCTSGKGAWYSLEYAAGSGGGIMPGEMPGKWFPRVDRNLDGSMRWQPSIHMPRWASRITLEITGVRVERLNDISNEDCIAEGVSSDMPIAWQSGDDTPIGMFGELWESINGPDSWGANPWVWVIQFKKQEVGR